jgi:hypothetical protein
MRRFRLALAVGAILASAACTAPAAVIIIDDGPSGSPNTADITWTPSSNAPDWNYRPESGTNEKPNSYNGSGSRFAYAGGGVETATYTPNIPRAGLWRVSMWWPTFDWTDNALVQINHTGGTSDFRIDQSTNSGQWNSLGYYDFAGGTGGGLTISSEGANPGTSNAGPVADAVRFDFAGGLLHPVAALASSSVDTTRRGPANVINGSGMTDANGDGILDTHATSDYGYDYSWLSGTGGPTGWFAVDLGGGYELDQMEFYNFNATAGNTNRGVRLADIYVSTLEDPGLPGTPDFSDSTVWRLVASDVELTQAPGTGGYNTPDLLDLGGVPGRWLALDIKSNWGNATFVGISEIQLFGVQVPEPSTFLLAGLGLVGLLLWRRRAGRQ